MRTPHNTSQQDATARTEGARLAAEFLHAWIPDPERAQRIKAIAAIYRARDEAAERQAQRAERRRHVADSIVVGVMLLGGLVVSRLLYDWGYAGPARLLTAGTTMNLLAWVAVLRAQHRG